MVSQRHISQLELSAKDLCEFVDNALPKLNYDISLATTSISWHPDQMMCIEVVPDRSFEKRCGDFRVALLRQTDQDRGLRVNETFFDAILRQQIDHDRCGSELSTQARVMTLVTSPVATLLTSCNKLNRTSCHHTIAREVRRQALQGKRPKQFRNQHDCFLAYSPVVPATSSVRRSARMQNQVTKPINVGSLEIQPSETARSETFCDLATTKLSGTELVAVGEIKVLWKHSLAFLRRLWSTPLDIPAQKEARHKLAQIVGYMQKFRLRCGYLTTYSETVFLRLAYESSNWVVQCSPIVYWNGQAHYDDRYPRMTGESNFNFRLALAMVQYCAWETPHVDETVFEAYIIASLGLPGREKKKNNKKEAGNHAQAQEPSLKSDIHETNQVTAANSDEDEIEIKTAPPASNVANLTASDKIKEVLAATKTARGRAIAYRRRQDNADSVVSP